MKLLETKQIWCDDVHEWELCIDDYECMPTIRMWRDGRIVAKLIILADGSECESPREFEPWPEFIQCRFAEAVEQIKRAEAEGCDGFDREKFGVKRAKQ